MSRIRSVCVLALVAAVVVPAIAQQVVIPNENEKVPGPSNNSYPWNRGDMRYQQVYAVDQFKGLTGIIQKFAYRPDEGVGRPFSTSGIDAEIRFSHTKASPTQMSTTFANNIGSDETVVWKGPLKLDSVGDPYEFDIEIDVDDVFSYNGRDNLLVDIKIFNMIATTGFDTAGTGLGQGGTLWTDRVWALGVNSTTGSSNGDDGMVTKFYIPEPASIIMLIGLAALRRR